MNQTDRLITRDELLRMVPYTIGHIYKLEMAGKFPQRVKVGARRVAWVYSEVVAWIEASMHARVGKSGNEPK